MGITGGTGSGKTTIAERILESLGPEIAAIIHQDSYYLDRASLHGGQSEGINYDHPSAFDSRLLRKQIRALRSGRSIQKPIYDFHTHSRKSETERVESRPVIILEGILIFEDPELREMMDMKIYVDADADVRFIRRLRRDLSDRGRSIESVINQYLSTVRPMHLRFIEPAKHFADIIIPEGGYNLVALDTIIAGIRALMNDRRELH